MDRRLKALEGQLSESQAPPCNDPQALATARASGRRVKRTARPRESDKTERCGETDKRGIAAT